MKPPTRIVDISATLDNDTVLDPPFMRPKIEYHTNAETGPLLCSLFPGLRVEDLPEGEGELVIKALDDRSITTNLISGASILGDGRVVLILNMVALMERFARGRADANGPKMAGLLSSLASLNTSTIATAAAPARGSAGGQS